MGFISLIFIVRAQRCEQRSMWLVAWKRRCWFTEENTETLHRLIDFECYCNANKLVHECASRGRSMWQRRAQNYCYTFLLLLIFRLFSSVRSFDPSVIARSTGANFFLSLVSMHKHRDSLVPAPIKLNDRRYAHRLVSMIFFFLIRFVPGLSLSEKISEHETTSSLSVVAAAWIKLKGIKILSSVVVVAIAKHNCHRHVITAIKMVPLNLCEMNGIKIFHSFATQFHICTNIHCIR